MIKINDITDLLNIMLHLMLLLRRYLTIIVITSKTLRSICSCIHTMIYILKHCVHIFDDQVYNLVVRVEAFLKLLEVDFVLFKAALV